MINCNNIWSGYGRLTADPELSTASNGTELCRFTIAVDEKVKGEKKTYFFDAVAFAHNARYLNLYAHQGDLVGVVASLTQNKYEDRDGKKRTSYNLRAESVSVVRSKEEKQEEKPALVDEGFIPVSENKSPLDDYLELPF